MGEPLRVLFVEDSQDDLELLLRELRKGGYDPEHLRVETELAMRAALETQSWEVILSDFSMPRFDGIAAFEIARAERPEIPFIFVSGRIGEERAVDAMRRGVKDYVLKDNLRRLIPAIRRELQEAQQRSAGRQALTVSEDKFKQLVEGSIQGISMMQKGKVVYSNPAHARMLGYGDPTALEGMDAFALIPPDDREEARRNGNPPMRGGTPANPYYRGLRKDGSVLWYEAHAVPTEWQGKRAQQWTLIDVTERKRAEEQLQASQRLLKTVFDAIPHFMVVKDLESRYLMVNKAWAEAYAVPAESVVGRLSTDVMTRPLAESNTFHDQDVVVMRGEGRTLKVESHYTIASGEQLRLEAIKTPLRDEQGKIVGLVGVFVDRSAERTAEQRADVAHARLSDAIESLHSGFMLFDKEERLLLWNRYLEQMLPGMRPLLRKGAAFEEMLREAAKGTAAPDVEGWVAARLVTFRTNPGRFEQQLKNGRWIEGFDQRTSDGGTVCLRFDVTNQKNQEMQLRQAQKMEAVGHLTGGVAHDFNNILTVILSSAEFLTMALQADHPSRKDVTVIQEAGQRAAALTRQLLAFSRRQVLRLRTVSLNGLVTDMSKMLRRLIGEHIDVQLRLEATPGDLRADPSQLEQVILNLAVNARDAMPNGGSLIIETQNQVLDEGYVQAHPDVVPGAYAMLAVSDTGIGMDQDTVRKIFEPFFTTKPAGQGTGLGLSTVYGIVKQMNGSVFVYSEPGKGTTFKVYFPASSGADAVPAQPAATKVPKRPTETILLVEDDEMVRRSAVRILVNAGYTVLEASSPEGAMQVVERHQGILHLLVSDVVMHGGTGPALWERLKTLRPIPALFMSGYTGDAATRQGLVDGNLPFLPKPFSAAALLEKIREVLDSSK